MSVFRIAIGQISQESNSFVSALAEIDLFRNSYLHEGDELFQLASSDTEIAGMLAVCQEEGAEVVPLIATRSVSGGPLSDECYGTLKSKMLARLRASGSVDAVLLSMHGSMLAESEDDTEGDGLAAIREIVGDAIPVVLTLDLHANVTPTMVQHASVIVAYEHYPHDDARDTGERAARLLFRVLSGEVRPAMALAKVPMHVSGCEGQTFGDGPMVHLTKRAREIEQEPNILSISCFHVNPYQDIPGCGSGAVVITDGDVDLAGILARDFAEEFWVRRHAFIPELLTVEQAVERGRAITGGPVLLVDNADCAGGGAAGDSAAVLREMLRLHSQERSHLMVVDPAAAEACAAAGIGSEIRVSLGHRIDPIWGEPLAVSGCVSHLSDGRFRYDGGMFGGTMASMGLSALIEIGEIRLLVMSKPTYDWADEQFRSVGLLARDAKFIGVKNPMNYRFAYRGIAKAAFIVDTPGPTPAIVHSLPFERIQHPIFPFEDGPAPPRVDTASRMHPVQSA